MEYRYREVAPTEEGISTTDGKHEELDSPAISVGYSVLF